MGHRNNVTRFSAISVVRRPLADRRCIETPTRRCIETPTSYFSAPNQQQQAQPQIKRNDVSMVSRGIQTNPSLFSAEHEVNYPHTSSTEGSSTYTPKGENMTDIQEEAREDRYISSSRKASVQDNVVPQYNATRENDTDFLAGASISQNEKEYAFGLDTSLNDREFLPEASMTSNGLANSRMEKKGLHASPRAVTLDHTSVAKEKKLPEVRAVTIYKDKLCQIEELINKKDYSNALATSVTVTVGATNTLKYLLENSRKYQIQFGGEKEFNRVIDQLLAIEHNGKNIITRMVNEYKQIAHNLARESPQNMKIDNYQSILQRVVILKNFHTLWNNNEKYSYLITQYDLASMSNITESVIRNIIIVIAKKYKEVREMGAEMLKRSGDLHLLKYSRDEYRKEYNFILQQYFHMKKVVEIVENNSSLFYEILWNNPFIHNYHLKEFNFSLATIAKNINHTNDSFRR